MSIKPLMTMGRGGGGVVATPKGFLFFSKIERAFMQTKF